VADNTDKIVKIGFVQKIRVGDFETETIWCQADGENFVVNNIPFIAKRISLEIPLRLDMIQKTKLTIFEDFVKPSGNSTIRIFLMIISLLISKSVVK
jgi:hypothetical protein